MAPLTTSPRIQSIHEARAVLQGGEEPGELWGGGAGEARESAPILAPDSDISRKLW
jgi:hypothetical protein